MSRRQKHRRLAVVVHKLQLRFGPKAIYRYERPARPPVRPHIPTGFKELDQALGIGGIPLGHITELTGPPTSGKTTVTAKVVAQAQAAGHQAAWVDLGWTVNGDYLCRCGVDPQRLLMVRPHSGREALDITASLLRSELGMLVFDDVTSLMGHDLSPTVLENGLARIHRAMARALRPGSGQTQCAVIFLTASHFGPPGAGANYPPGFHLRHYAAVRLALRLEEWIQHHGDVRGYLISVTTLKNRLAPSAGPVQIRITFNGTVHGDVL